MPQPLPRQDRAALWVRLCIRGVLTVICLFLASRFGPRLLSLFAPFLLALVMAWLLHPPVRWLQKKLGISRKIIAMAAVVLFYGAIGGILFGLLYIAFLQARSLVENWVAVRQSLVDMVTALSAFLSDLTRSFPPILSAGAEGFLLEGLDWVQAMLPSALDASLDGAGNLVSRVPTFAIATVVFMMASYFITADYPRLRFMATDRLPASTRDFGRNFCRIFRDAFGGYIKSQLILSFGVFCILSLGFFIMQQPYGLLLAFLFAILDFIPIIGAGTIMVPWAVVDLVLGEYRAALGLLLIWGIIVLFRRLAEPKILGDQTGLSPILSLVGIYVGMRLAGVLGMIVGPLLLLMLINLWKLGTFDPFWNDVKLCAGDFAALLRAGRGPKE